MTDHENAKIMSDLIQVNISRNEEIKGYKSDIKARVELRAEDRRILEIKGKEIKKLRNALETIRDWGHAENHEDAWSMMDIAKEALEE